MASIDLLSRLLRYHTFDPAALPGARTIPYCPFDELLDNEDTEFRLIEHATQGDRVAVIGAIGAGKSSLVEYVVKQLDGDYAAIWVSVAIERPETIVETGEFLRHLIREVGRWATEVSLMSEKQIAAILSDSSERLPGRSTTNTNRFGLRVLARWLGADLAKEISTTLEGGDQIRSHSHLVAVLDELVAIIQQAEKVPILFIDDSDRWIKARLVDRTDTANRFFSEVIRAVAERRWGIVMCVHPQYERVDGFQQARSEGWLNAIVRLPRLRSADDLRAFLTARIHVEARRTESSNVFSDGAIEALYEHYSRSFNLRGTLSIVETALRETVANREEHITRERVVQTIIDLVGG